MGNVIQHTEQDKMRARRRIQSAVKRGETEKPSLCESCGTRAVLQAHHEDYNKPLSVKWLCRSCHNSQHKSNADPSTTMVIRVPEKQKEEWKQAARILGMSLSDWVRCVLTNRGLDGSLLGLLQGQVVGEIVLGALQDAGYDIVKKVKGING